MPDIVEFLEARIADDEQLVEQIGDVGASGGVALFALFAWAPDPWPIELNRSRLQGECAAKRAVLALHCPASVTTYAYGPTIRTIGTDGRPYSHSSGGHFEVVDACLTCSNFGREDDDIERFPCDTIRAIAAIYADHPDYQHEWKPE